MSLKFYDAKKGDEYLWCYTKNFIFFKKSSHEIKTYFNSEIKDLIKYSVVYPKVDECIINGTNRSDRITDVENFDLRSNGSDIKKDCE